MLINKEKNFISAVLYVHNNQDTIKDFLQKLYKLFDSNFEKYEVICVNDASTDESVDIIKNTVQEFQNCVINIINMSFYQGIELSMNAGIDLSIGDFVFEFDSNDIDYDIQMIMDIYFHSLKGYDIVSANNTNKKFTSNLFYKLYNKNANTQYMLKTEAFRILSRRAINRILSMSKTIPYRKALYSQCGLKTDTVIYTVVNTKRVSYSKIQTKKRRDTAFSTLILFTDVAYKISIFMTFMMMFLTLAGGIYTIAIYLLKRPVEGYTTLMLLLTGSFFAMFAILAIIIKYLSLIVDLIFKKQKYITESIEKITK